MLLEPYNATIPLANFSLAFKQPLTNEKYYILPKEGDDKDVIPLSIHKNPSVNKYVFEARSTVVPGLKY